MVFDLILSGLFVAVPVFLLSLKFGGRGVFCAWLGFALMSCMFIWTGFLGEGTSKSEMTGACAIAAIAAGGVMFLFHKLATVFQCRV